jgi:hypothetical protein
MLPLAGTTTMTSYALAVARAYVEKTTHVVHTCRIILKYCVVAVQTVAPHQVRTA